MEAFALKRLDASVMSYRRQARGTDTLEHDFLRLGLSFYEQVG